MKQQKKKEKKEKKKGEVIIQMADNKILDSY